MSKLLGKVAIVTGSGKGIGKEIAKCYASEGAKVAVVSRTLSDLESLAKEINGTAPGKALPIQGDISIERDAKRMVQKTVEEFGRVDILVNNAATGSVTKSFEVITEADWDQTMDINVKGAFLLTREVLPLMLKRKSGNIINVSSGAGVKKPIKHVRSVTYTVSKFALEGLSHALAVRLLGSGVNVNVLRPGFTRTSIQAQWTPEEVKRMAVEIGHFLEPDSANGPALYLAALKPGELTDSEIDVFEWLKKNGP